MPRMSAAKARSDAHRVEGALREEMTVLGRNHGIDDDGRDLREGDVDAVLLGERRQHVLPARVVDERRLLQGRGAREGDSGQVIETTCHGRESEQKEGEQPASPAPPARPLLVLAAFALFVRGGRSAEPFELGGRGPREGAREGRAKP